MIEVGKFDRQISDEWGRVIVLSSLSDNGEETIYLYRI